MLRLRLALLSGFAAPLDRLLFVPFHADATTVAVGQPVLSLFVLALVVLTAPVTAEERRLDRSVAPTFQSIHLNLDANEVNYNGSVRIELAVETPAGSFYFHAAEMTLDRVALSGESGIIDISVAQLDSILEHAPFETAAGRIPSNNVELNGEMMQVLSRLCFMTDNKAYLDMACRIADYYLLGNHHPTRDSEKLGLRDHNCELISGLTEVYAACHAQRSAKADAYREPLRAMLDRILEVGINEHGLMYDMVNPRTGQILRKSIGDNWGYNYNGFYTVYMLDGVDPYRQATQHALASLKPHYWEFAWQGWGSDGIADSVEGAINLFSDSLVVTRFKPLDQFALLLDNLNEKITTDAHSCGRSQVDMAQYPNAPGRRR